MASVTETIDIRAPRDRVFNAITDPRRTMEWNTNIAEVRDIEGYPPREGTSWIQVAVIAGRKATLQCRIVRWQAPVYGLLEIQGDQRGIITTRCDDLGGITRVTQTIEFEPPGGVLGRMASGVMGSAIGREIRAALGRQRAALEVEAGGNRGPGPA